MSLNDMLTTLNQHIPSAFNELPVELQQEGIYSLILLSLAEDLAPPQDISDLPDLIKHGDITSAATIPTDKVLKGRISAKQDGVIAGLPIAAAVFKLVDPAIMFTAQVEDGRQVKNGQVLAEVSGPGIALLAAERTALNFLGRLSGIATLTHQFVDAVSRDMCQYTGYTQDRARLTFTGQICCAHGRRPEPPHGTLRHGAHQRQPHRRRRQHHSCS